MSRYEFDASTISWAERRVKELGQSRVNAGYALEMLRNAIVAMRDAGDEMNNHPESEMIRDLAKDIEKKTDEFERRFQSWEKDRSDIVRGILDYEEKLRA